MVSTSIVIGEGTEIGIDLDPLDCASLTLVAESGGEIRLIGSAEELYEFLGRMHEKFGDVLTATKSYRQTQEILNRAMKHPWNTGAMAFEEGKKIADNPFNVESDEWGKWNSGFAFARDGYGKQ